MKPQFILIILVTLFIYSTASADVKSGLLDVTVGSVENSTSISPTIPKHTDVLNKRLKTLLSRKKALKDAGVWALRHNTFSDDLSMTTVGDIYVHVVVPEFKRERMKDVVEVARIYCQERLFWFEDTFSCVVTGKRVQRINNFNKKIEIVEVRCKYTSIMTLDGRKEIGPDDGIVVVFSDPYDQSEQSEKGEELRVEQAKRNYRELYGGKECRCEKIRLEGIEGEADYYYLCKKRSERRFILF